MNQACGRVIRHVHDYGAIILADERFQVCFQPWKDQIWALECYKDEVLCSPESLLCALHMGSIHAFIHSSGICGSRSSTDCMHTST